MDLAYTSYKCTIVGFPFLSRQNTGRIFCSDNNYLSRHSTDFCIIDYGLSDKCINITISKDSASTHALRTYLAPLEHLHYATTPSFLQA